MVISSYTYTYCGKFGCVSAPYLIDYLITGMIRMSNGTTHQVMGNDSKTLCFAHSRSIYSISLNVFRAHGAICMVYVSFLPVHLLKRFKKCVLSRFLRFVTIHASTYRQLKSCPIGRDI